jgi:succinyl-diaminopimelate desuccinylase
MSTNGEWANDVSGLLRRLIAIPSVNPDGDPGAGSDGTGELDCAEFVGGLLGDLGADVWYDEVLPNRPNVIGRFPTNGKGKPRILLAPHTDTVGVNGMIVDPFGGEIRDGKIYGRGACDTKGTMAAMLWALKSLGADGIANLDVEVAFTGLMGEETGQPGSRDFAEKYGSEYDFALIGEPTMCDIVYKHKGTLWTTLSTRGKAVHGSTPELGENAVAKMAKIITALDTDFREQLANPDFSDPVLGNSTVNLGICRGGSRPNIVPDSCILTVDMRVTPKVHASGSFAMLERFLQPFDVESKPTLACSPLNTDAAHPMVQRLQALPNAPKLVGAPWFCDAAILSEGGIPAVAGGPGSIAQAHTIDEWIAIGALEAGVEFYRDFLIGNTR